MTHWTVVKHLAPHLPVVDVDMGDALLELNADPQHAQASFREGIKNDPENAAVYTGLDEAMSLTGASAEERAAVLSQYPSADAPESKMSAALVYQLGLTRAEAEQFKQAIALFKDRFFPSEEGGITPNQVLFEIKLMQAEAWAKAHDCADAQGFLDNDARGLSRDGRSSSREYFLLAGIARSCGDKKESDEFLHQADAGAESGDLTWSIQAERSLGTYDAASQDQRVAKALSAAESRAQTSANSELWYNIGLLQVVGGQKGQARTSFEQALILPDMRMSHHLAREALAGLSGGK
jgi:Tfp pilus assembly protein PilF